LYATHVRRKREYIFALKLDGPGGANVCDRCCQSSRPREWNTHTTSYCDRCDESLCEHCCTLRDIKYCGMCDDQSCSRCTMKTPGSAIVSSATIVSAIDTLSSHWTAAADVARQCVLPVSKTRPNLSSLRTRSVTPDTIWTGMKKGPTRGVSHQSPQVC
jgi:hypothetical protein